MTPNQLPPLQDVLAIARKMKATAEDCSPHPRYSDSMIAFRSECIPANVIAVVDALAALAQQAQEREPVAAVLGDIVALWDLYAPSQHMTAMHMRAKRALAGQQPVSPDLHRWCAYVGGMVAHWVMSEPNAHVRLGDDQFEAAIAGIIERRLWAMPKRDTTPQPQPDPVVPAPVDERAEFEASMREKHGWEDRDFKSDSFGYFDGHTATAWLAWQDRAALSKPAPQAGEVTDEQIDAVSLAQWGPHHGAPLAAHRAFARAILALRPAETLTGCNCRWDGETQVEWCELHLAHKEAIHEWAERAKAAEQQLALRPQAVPMTDEQLCEALGIDGSDDWTYTVRDAVEAHHFITAKAEGLKP